MDSCPRRRSCTFSRALASTSHLRQLLLTTPSPCLFFKPQYLESQHPISQYLLAIYPSHNLLSPNIRPPHLLPPTTPQIDHLPQLTSPNPSTMSGNLGLALYHYHSIHYHLACHNALTPTSPPLTLSHIPAGQTPPPPLSVPTTITSTSITKQIQYAFKQVWRYAAAAIWSERHIIGLFASMIIGLPVMFVGPCWVMKHLCGWLLPEMCEHT